MKRSHYILISAVLIGLAGPCVAGDPAPFRDFTFKRVKVPSGNAQSRITVQIDPEEQAAYLAVPKGQGDDAPDESADATAPKGGQADTPAADLLDWYWNVISPDLASASAGRLERAVAHLANGPSDGRIAAPRLQAMQDIAATYGTEILKASIGTQVSPALALAVIGIESSGRADAESSAGAQGLMQLIPATADRFDVNDALDPVQNIRGGIAYLDWLMGEFNQDPILVLAAYNAGENAVKRHQGVPPYAETRAYVPKVLAAWSVAQGLCSTPPELASDGCVFKIKEVRHAG